MIHAASPGSVYGVACNVANAEHGIERGGATVQGGLSSQLTAPAAAAARDAPREDGIVWAHIHASQASRTATHACTLEVEVTCA